MSSALAIAGVSAVLQYYLNEMYGAIGFLPTVTVSSIAPDLVQENFGTSTTGQSQVNVFLHQVTHNLAWRNQCLPSLGPDGKTAIGNPPLALDLHYLLTAYGSDDWQAEALLGFALLMLHQNPVLTRADISSAISALPSKIPGNPLSGQLGTTDLAQQIEMLKITPATLGREEMAWLWTALKADYRPTYPFQVSVVLIQPEVAASSPVPVLTRTVAAQASFATSFPHLAQAIPPAGKAAPTLGDTVTVQGTALKDTTGILLSTALQRQQLSITSLQNLSDKSFQFVIPNPAPPPPGSSPTDLPAGVYVLTATVTTTTDTLTTNSIPLTIAPKITSAFPATLQSGNPVHVPVTCAPFVRDNQQVSLLIGGQQAPADSFQGATNTPSFTFTPLQPTSASVPVWLRVDGVDSQIVDSSGTTPTYSGPLTQVK